MVRHGYIRRRRRRTEAHVTPEFLELSKREHILLSESRAFFHIFGRDVNREIRRPDSIRLIHNRLDRLALSRDNSNFSIMLNQPKP